MHNCAQFLGSPDFHRISTQDSAGVRNFEENPLRAFVRLALMSRTVLVRLPTDIAIPAYQIKSCAHVWLCTKARVAEIEI